jgi:hypothetical protein
MKTGIEYMPQEVAFSIDLESGSGHNQSFPGREPDETTGDIIGIGAAVVAFNNETKEFEIWDTFLERLRREGLSVISKDCFDNFWNRDKEAKIAFPKLIVDKEDHIHSRDFLEKHAVTRLLQFATRWRNECKEQGYKFRSVSNCGSFDFGNIDYMIMRHLPGTKGTLHIGGGWNGAVRCVTSKEETLLGMVDTHWTRRQKAKGESYDITERVRQLYGVPAFPAVHDHMPDNDAVVHACRYLMVKAIEDGVFTLNEDLIEAPPEDAVQPFYSAKKRKCV